MSLGCGNCRRFDFGPSYFMLYLLEKERGQLAYIDEFERHVSPNCALCPSCVSDAHRQGRQDVSGLDAGFALVAASSGGDRPSWSDILTNPSTARYFDVTSVTAKWPRAIEIIESMPRLSPEPVNASFVATLFAHLRIGQFRFHDMAELAPGVVIVRDNYGQGAGELDVLFDLGQWEAAHPKVWGSEGLAPPGLKRVGVGILSEKACAPPPRNFMEFHRLARVALRARQGAAWYAKPRLFKIPPELSA